MENDFKIFLNEHKIKFYIKKGIYKVEKSY